VAVTVHLNLMEGNSLCDPGQVPLLTNEKGQLSCSFANLLVRSFLPGRDKLRHQLKQELKAQILAVQKVLPAEVPLRLDGHAHYHMIPVVFDAMMDVIREEDLPVSYIRISREYLRLYLPHFFRLRDLSAINLVKVAVLNLLSGLARMKYTRELAPMEKKLFLGVALSGRMYYENLKVFFPQARKLAEKKGWDLEILGHPGGVFEELRNPDVDIVLTGEICEWMLGEYARDAGQLGLRKALLVLGHIPSEKEGMRLLADEIFCQFPDLEVKYFECGEFCTSLQ
jgi:hypothetical protein